MKIKMMIPKHNPRTPMGSFTDLGFAHYSVDVTCARINSDTDADRCGRVAKFLDEEGWVLCRTCAIISARNGVGIWPLIEIEVDLADMKAVTPTPPVSASFAIKVEPVEGVGARDDDADIKKIHKTVLGDKVVSISYHQKDSRGIWRSVFIEEKDVGVGGNVKLERRVSIDGYDIADIFSSLMSWRSKTTGNPELMDLAIIIRHLPVMFPHNKTNSHGNP